MRHESSAPSPKKKSSRTTIDLGTIRYLSPQAMGDVWLGLDGGGIYIPKRLKFANQDVAIAHISLAWALGIAPWLSVGGKSGWLAMQFGGVRLIFVHHTFELVGQPGFGRFGPKVVSDRLAMGVESHRLDRIYESSIKTFPGGFRDLMFRLDYGMSHQIAKNWRIGWSMQLRAGWVYVATQRQIRPSFRVSYALPRGHSIWIDGVGFGVHRDPNQRGVSMPRYSVHGQLSMTHNWQSTEGIGVATTLRYTTGFLSGEAPVYEAQPESLKTAFVEASIGIRWKLPRRRESRLD